MVWGGSLAGPRGSTRPSAQSNGYVEEEFERRKRGEGGDGKHGYVLLRELMKLMDDRLFIRNELMNIFFPTRDTA